MGSRRHAAALNLMYESEQRKCSGYEIILCVLGHETILILDTFLQMKVRFCVVYRYRDRKDGDACWCWLNILLSSGLI